MTSDCDLGSYGTCYAATECEALGGSSMGQCASGFGVCCTFSGGCGGTTSINNTYFSGSNSDSSPCQFSVCRVSSDVCQIRLNFDTFEISQPSTAVLPTSNTATLPGQRTQCLEAQFRLVSVVERRLRWLLLQCDGCRPCSSCDLRLQQGSTHDSWLVF